MLTAIVTVLLTFVLTSVVGSSVLHSWQQHNWVVQRRIIEAEDQYKALQKTFDDISDLAGKRQHRMFRLLSAIWRGTDDVIEKRLSDYDESSLAWNEKLATSIAKLTMQLSYWRSTRLESEIQARFVKLDAELTRLAAARLKGTRLSPADFQRLSQALNVLNGQIVRFNKAILRDIEEKRSNLYRAKPITSSTLDSVPTWQLFKALFKSGKPSPDGF